MARRARPGSADLAQIDFHLPRAIPRRNVERRGVFVSRLVRQRRAVRQILRGIRMVGTFKFTMLPLAAIVLAAGAMTSRPAAAQQVGTATAVNQSSESTPAGGSTIALTVGSRILHNQR